MLIKRENMTLSHGNIHRDNPSHRLIQKSELRSMEMQDITSIEKHGGKNGSFVNR